MRILLTTALTAAICFCPALAQDKSRLALDGSLGTSGLGVNLQYKVQNKVVIRGGYNYLDFDVADENYDGVDYDVSLDMTTFSGFVDFHPFENGFVVSGGVFGGGNKEVLLEGMPTEDVEIGSQTFTPEQVGTLTGRAELEDMAPYVGIGWDGSLYSGSPVNFLVRAGAMFTGAPEIDLDSTGGLLSDDASFRAELDQEEANLEAEVDDFEVFPVLNVGVSMRF